MKEFIIGIDPGENFGFCYLQTENGFPANVGTVKGEQEIWDWIARLSPFKTERLVIEDFHMDPRKNFAWNTLTTVQYIGALKYAARQLDIPVTMQRPAIKPVAYGTVGLEYKKGRKNQHETDAMVHAHYYWLHNVKDAQKSS